MQRFKNILVVLNLPEYSALLIDRAVSLAHRNQASLTVITFSEDFPPDMSMLTAWTSADVEESGINIIEDLPPNASVQDTLESADDPEFISDPLKALSPEAGMPASELSHLDIQEQIAEADDHVFERIIASIRQAGVQADGKVLDGTPFLEIIREVLRNEHDLVMIAAENGIGLKEMFFGSTAMHLMRKCPCPVWVVRPDQPERYTRILAAVDPNPEDDVRNALNAKIMELATSLARREQSELIIIHAWTVVAESILRSGRARLPDVDKIVKETREVHKRWLSTFLGNYSFEDLQCQVYMLKGDAGKLIPALAKAKEVELIVMGTVSRTGVAGLLIGNTAESVLSQVNCSVLTVKPDGFISPVKLDRV